MLREIELPPEGTTVPAVHHLANVPGDMHFVISYHFI